MKIFISWSGGFSKEIAGCLKTWIPNVIQAVDIFYSPDDIEKGENWNSKLSDELSSCNFGVVCLTPQNVTAPWINFEAGALAKVMGSRVSSLMIGINDSDIKGPLSRFQNTKFRQDDVFKLMQSINKNIERPLNDEVLKSTFNIRWPELDSQVTNIIKNYSDEKIIKPKEKPINEAVEEILRLVRRIDEQAYAAYRSGSSGKSNFNERYLREKSADITPDISKLLKNTKTRNRLSNMDLEVAEEILGRDFLMRLMKEVSLANVDGKELANSN